MTLYQFKLLEKDEQPLVLLEYGIMVADKETANHRFLLYQIDSFYVEVVYDLKQKKNFLLP